MVTVPRLTEQTVAPRASGVPFQDPSAPSAAFGTPIADAAGQQLSEFSGMLAEAQDRIHRRQAAVNRAKIRGEIREQMQADFTAEMTAGTAFGAPNALEAYSAIQRERVESAVAEHASQYGEESALMLREAFESDLSNLVMSGAQAGVEAGKAAISREIDVFVRRQGAMAFADPGSLMDRFADIDQEILTQYGDALTPEEEMSIIENARATVVESAANHFIVRGDFNSAEAVLNNPVAVDNLSADRGRNIRSTIANGRHQAAIRAAQRPRAPTTVEVAMAAARGEEWALQTWEVMNPTEEPDDQTSIPTNLALLRGQLGVTTGHRLVDDMTPEEAQNFYLSATDNQAAQQIDPLMMLMAAQNPELASMVQAGESLEDRRERIFGTGGESAAQQLGPVAPPVAGESQPQQQQQEATEPEAPAPEVAPDIQAMSDAEIQQFILEMDVNGLPQSEVEALLRELERRGLNE